MDDRAGLVDSQWEETGLKKGVSSAVNPLFKMAIISGVETIVRLHVNRCKDVNCQDGGAFTSDAGCVQGIRIDLPYLAGGRIRPIIAKR